VRALRRGLLLGAAIVAVPVAPLMAQSNLPDGSGASIARSACLGCHGADLIIEQRLTRAGWDREVAKMERWSTPTPAADRGQLLDYLTSLPLRRSTSSLAAAEIAAGEVAYRRACLSCHDGALVEQQRLSDVAWRRSITKMVQWGARVEPTEVAAIALYLEGRYGPP
jgi:mono/diheme cytochrome c family protein